MSVTLPIPGGVSGLARAEEGAAPAGDTAVPPKSAVHYPDKGPDTGLPLPRFVSLKAGTANLRAGPGQNYPIRWVYHRRQIPLQVFDEHGNWRAVRDPWGGEGWLHSTLLSGVRTAIVTADMVALRAESDPAAPVILYAERRVIGLVESCRAGWCRITVDSRTGWMPSSRLFGGATPGTEKEDD